MELYYNRITDFINTQYITEYPINIHNKLLYILNDGKKIRSILYLCFASLEEHTSSCLDTTPDYINISHNVSLDTIQTNIIMYLCVSIELIHCVSLIIDDLPELDNDNIRRGKQSFHIKYGIEYTHFFIYYILNKIFIILNNKLDTLINSIKQINNCDNNTCDNNTYINIYKQYTKYIIDIFKFNINNLIDGQYLDLEYTKLTLTNTQTINSKNNNTLYNIIIKIIYKCLDTSESSDASDTSDTSDTSESSEIYKNILLNLKKTGTLFALTSSISYIGNLFFNNINNINNLLKIIQYMQKSKIIHTQPDTQPVTQPDTQPDTQTQTNTNNSDSDSDSYSDSYSDNNNNIDNIDNIDNIVIYVEIWGYILGYIFQISDDILDCDADKCNNKPNICNILGINKSIILFNNCCKWLENNIIIINNKTNDILKSNTHINIKTIMHIIDTIKKRV